MNTAGNQELVRITNQNLILDLIKEKGVISRADIAKILNLSPPSTSSNISSLLEMDLLTEVGEGASSGGRKPILLELNKNYGFMVGIDMGGEEIKVSLGNICAEIIDSVYFKPDYNSSGIGILINIMSSINGLTARNKIEKKKIKTILIAAPGVYDRTANTFTASRIPGWEDINLIGALETEYNADVLVKNDVSIAALGEYIFGIKKSCRNMLFVNADVGIGAGIIINGELYEGGLGAAGIIRSMAFSKEHLASIYKKNGYLETSVSTVKLIQKIKNMCRDDKQLLELCSGNIERLDLGILKRAYEKNHMIVRNELDRVVDLIALSIGNINTVLNVDTIVLGGKMAILGEYFIISIKRVVGEICSFIPYITYSVLKENSAIYGLFAVGQDHMLKSQL